MEEKFLEAKIATDLLIYSGEEFTLNQLYKMVEDLTGEKIRKVSYFTSIKSYLNELERDGTILHLPNKDDWRNPIYKLNAAAVEKAKKIRERIRN